LLGAVADGQRARCKTERSCVEVTTFEPGLNESITFHELIIRSLDI
jgi:hypothetical protein